MMNTRLIIGLPAFHVAAQMGSGRFSPLGIRHAIQRCASRHGGALGRLEGSGATFLRTTTQYGEKERTNLRYELAG